MPIAEEGCAYRESGCLSFIVTLLVDTSLVIFLAIDDSWMKLIDVGGLAAAAAAEAVLLNEYRGFVLESRFLCALSSFSSTCASSTSWVDR